MSTESPIRALLLTSYFPPIAGAGVFRWYYFIKYLSASLDFTILTRQPEEGEPTDHSLVDIEKFVDVIRFNPRSLSSIYRKFKKEGKNEISTQPGDVSSLQQWIQIPDQRVAEIYSYYAMGKEIVKKKKIKLIIATAPHYSVLIAGYLLKRKFPYVKFIVDLRDPWSIAPLFPYPTAFHQKLNYFLEEQVLKLADEVIVVNEVMKETYIKNFPFVVAKLDVIYNGFDRESIDRVKPIIFKEVAVSYVGTLYAYRNPMLILKGAKIFCDRGGEGVKIIFAGELKPPWNSNLRKRIFKMKLNDLIEMRGYVKREEAISIMKGSSALIHIVGNYPAGLSAKIFEYVYTGKPICVIKDESGVVVNFLKKVGANYYHCRSAGEFDRFLEDLLSGKIKGKPFPEKILNFTREKMAKKFMEIVEEVVR